MNPISSRQHDATLRAINAGATRAELAASLSGARGGTASRTVEINAIGLDAYQVAQESRAVMRHEIRSEAVPLP